jgi:hypothetical protein
LGSSNNAGAHRSLRSRSVRSSSLTWPSRPRSAYFLDRPRRPRSRTGSLASMGGCWTGGWPYRARYRKAMARSRRVESRTAETVLSQARPRRSGGARWAPSQGARRTSGSRKTKGGAIKLSRAPKVVVSDRAVSTWPARTCGIVRRLTSAAARRATLAERHDRA